MNGALLSALGAIDSSHSVFGANSGGRGRGRGERGACEPEPVPERGARERVERVISSRCRFLLYLHHYRYCTFLRGRTIAAGLYIRCGRREGKGKMR
jgi:hypothetical protein